MSNTTLTSISVSGTNFDVPRDLFLHLKSLPWCAQTGGGSSVVAIEADPDAFRWLLHYVRHKSLPDSFWEDEDMESLHTLAVVLGMHELVQFLCERRAERHLPEHHSGEKRLLSTWQSVRGSRKKRSWQNRKVQGAKRKLDALAASFLRGSVVRKRSKSYEELVHPSDCVK